MNVEVVIVKHSEQRYETVGDWYYYQPTDTLKIFVSDLGDWRYNFLVAFHEQAEAVICINRKIPEPEVTKFDLWYEGRRVAGDDACQFEPGDHPLAPYRKEHFFATSIERLLAAELGVDWEEYDAAIQRL